MFSAGQILSICKILSVTPDVLNAQILYLSDKLTPEIETAIGEQITEWDSGAGRNFSSFTATESNKGFNLSADAAKNEIRSAIAIWLDCPEWATTNGIGRLRRS